MSTNNYYLSVCVPVYNEEEIILKKISEINSGLTKILGKKNCEIIVIENGSTDNTLRYLKKIQNTNTRIFSLKKKAHGLALKTGVEKARGEYVLLTAIDLPFGFSDLEEMLKLSDQYDVIFGSKAHPKSVIYSPIARKISSKIYRTLLKILFNINLGDTQGTVFLKRKSILPFLKYCTSENAFFTAQLAIFSRINNLKITEVPVVMKNEVLRRSRYNILSNGSEMLMAMLKAYVKIKLQSPEPKINLD